MLPREEQFSGSLIGQALGDALGALVEGMEPEDCASYVEMYLSMPEAAHPRLVADGFGQYTDDSQLARELMQSYVACGAFFPEDYARRIAAIFAEDRIVGYGMATFLAARQLAEGVSWEHSGTLPPAAGNGTAMRAGPVGLIHFDDPERLARVAHDQGRITHQDRRCSAGAIAIAGAVAMALHPGPLNVATFTTDLAARTEGWDPILATGIRHLPEWAAHEPVVIAPIISIFGFQGESKKDWPGISPFVTSSVLWSLYAFLHSPEDYWETIRTAIVPGGDVDTTAAMAGAISGAHVGLSAIPARWARCITDQGTWGYDELVALAHQAHALTMDRVVG